MEGKKTGRAPYNSDRLYRELLHDLHHGLRSFNCTILGVCSLDIPDAEKLEMIGGLALKLDKLTKQISQKHNSTHP